MHGSKIALAWLAVASWSMAAELEVSQFGAKGDDQIDDSAAIQRALDAAAERGQTVELGVGRFRIDAGLRVPRGVTLAGVWSAPHHAQLDRGTLLEIRAGQGQESGPPAVFLSPSSAVRGITFYYPDQRVPEVVAYPWTIQGEGMHCSVIDCTFVNPYRAIDFGTLPNELHYIRNCFGCPLKAGVFIDRCTDIGRIENVHFNPHYWARAEGEYQPAWPALSKYLFENLVAFQFVRTDWEYVHNTFCFGAKVGYLFSGGKHGTVNGNFLGLGADWCGRAMLVEQCQPPGLLITNGEFVGGNDTRVMLEVAASNTGHVQLANCSFWGPADAAALIDGKGTTSFSQCLFLNHGKGSAGVHTVEALGGDLLLQSCRFGIASPDIRIGPKVDTAVISGNWFKASKEIVNESRGDVQMGLNVVGQRPANRPADRQQ